MSKSTLSITKIKKIISTVNNLKREKEKQKLINSNYATVKDTTPMYKVEDIKFYPTTRNAKITFIETKSYRTIKRYITQNYTKYPIYSDWKTKTKKINKSIKLTNLELENLNKNNDPIISCCADEIIQKINIEELFPSWFIKKYTLLELEEELNKLNEKKISDIDNTKNKIEDNKKDINYYNNEINYVKSAITIQNCKKDKLIKILNKLEKAKKSVALIIFTFGIYGLLNSKKRYNKIKNRYSLLVSKINKNINFLTKFEKNIEISNKNIKILTKNIETINKNYSYDKKIIENKYSEVLNNIKPLKDFTIVDKSFKPLKSFLGCDYKKIIGCYIIHNKENDKYYVGQSKDILKRLKQHFKGTIPNNIIFAEDYYSSKNENKDELFEVKIIKCKTKDELDKKEKELIELYDSMNSGYNRTSGNM